MKSFNLIINRKIREDEALREYWDENLQTTRVSFSAIEDLRPIEYDNLKSMF